jgi:tRNA pseudouridine38-40 synthase
MRYFLEIAYRGTLYAGWQVQKNAKNTVQGLLHQALGYVLGQETETTAGGRTDAGVHCKSQFVHFDSEIVIDKEKFLFKLNRCLPEDIWVSKLWQVKNTSHARFDALSRSYEYHISLEKNPFAQGLMLRYWQKLDITAMNEAANILLQHTDFECFSKVNTDVKTFQCQIYKAVWEQEANNLVFYITANRFLRGMVRAIVGTLLDVGRCKTSLADFEQIILSKKRTAAGRNVPPDGLFLVAVRYPEVVYQDQSLM